MKDWSQEATRRMEKAAAKSANIKRQAKRNQWRQLQKHSLRLHLTHPVTDDPAEIKELVLRLPTTEVRGYKPDHYDLDWVEQLRRTVAPRSKFTALALLLCCCAFTATAQCHLTNGNSIISFGVMAPECHANITNRYVFCSYATNSWPTNTPAAVPITLTLYQITNSDGSFYDTGVNISFRAWPTNATYELQWSENLTSPVWFGYGVCACWPTNYYACYSGPLRSSKCPARFFRVMSGPSSS